MTKSTALVSKRRGAQLPQSYETAKAAIAACATEDECAKWADRGAALRAYARQTKDKTLERNAARIRLRAFRRLGELLDKKPAKAHRGKKGGPARAHLSERAKAAADAGLSTKEKKTALRIFNVKADLFEEAVESNAPPTVTEMADAGMKKIVKAVADYLDGRDPKDYARSLNLQGAIRDLAEDLRECTPETFVRGCTPDSLLVLRADSMMLREYLANVLTLTGEP